MMRHFYTPLLQGQAQQVLEGFGEQRFWLGHQYGVAIRRQAGTDLIAITADAREILKLRQEMGLQRLLDDLATNRSWPMWCSMTPPSLWWPRRRRCSWEQRGGCLSPPGPDRI
jgi:hypothetical protein